MKYHAVIFSFLIACHLTFSPSVGVAQPAVGEFFLAPDLATSSHALECDTLLHPDSVRGMTGVVSNNAYADWYRTGGMEQGSASFQRALSLRYWTKFHWHRSWLLQLDLNDRIAHYGFQNDAARQSMMMKTRSSTSSLLISSAVTPQVVASGEIRVGQFQDHAARLAASIHAKPYGSALFAWSHDVTRVDIFGIYQTNALAIRYASLIESFDVRLRAREWRGVELAATQRFDNWIQYESKRPEPWLEPFGSGGSKGFAVSYRRGEHQYEMRYQYRSLDLMAYGWDEPYPYAKATAFQTGSNQYALAYTHQDVTRWSWQATVEHSNGTGYSRGHLEFWPFGSGWIDFLSMRRYYIASWDHQLYSSSISLFAPRRGDVQIAFRARYFDLFAHANLRHWKPVFLVFGVDDEQYAVLPIARQQFASLTASVDWKVNSRLVGSYAFEQYFPIQQWKNRTAESQGTTSPTSTANRHSQAYGGGLHTLRFHYIVR